MEADRRSCCSTIGVRFDSFRYKLSDTGGPARNFWFNAFNNSYCVLPGAGQVPFYNPANDHRRQSGRAR